MAQCNLPPEMDVISQIVTINKPIPLDLNVLMKGYFDPEGDSLASIRVESLPASGLLSFNGNPVTVNQVVSKTELANLQYVNNSHQQGDYIIVRPNDGYNWAAKSNKLEFVVQIFESIEFSSLNLQSEYKWGDYNNDGIIDLASSAGVLKNQNNDFQIIDSIVLETTTINWADIDNDSDLDLLFQEHIISNDGNDIFNETSILGLNNLENNSTKGTFGDLNNDNQPDYLLSGCYNDLIPFSKVFINNGFGNYPDSLIINLLGFRHGAIACGDYDSDGNQDIAICGIYSNNERKTIIYRNENGQFVDIEANLPGVSVGTLDWGDFDKDGDLDLLLCGSQGTYDNSVTQVYQNNNGSFALFQNNPSWEPIYEVFRGFAKWADIDCDGYLDVLLGGFINYPAQSVRFYKNIEGEGFSLISRTGLPYLNSVSCNLADYNNDGYIDMILSGINKNDEEETAIFRNGYGTDSSNSNSPPNTPENLRVSVSDYSVSFSWDKSNDDSTPQEALSYNIYVYSNLDSIYVVSPLTDTSSGFRKIVSIGNTSLNNSFTIDSLPLGTYKWSVQAIDNSFAGGLFAAQQTFIVQESNAKHINIQCFIEGSYNASTASMDVTLDGLGLIPLLQPYNQLPWNYDGDETINTPTADVVDWVLVELRQAVTPETALPSTILNGWPKALLLKQDGSLIAYDGSLPSIDSATISENIYIVIRHRNHVGIMSNGPAVLTGNTYSYDFTDDITKAYGADVGYKEIATGIFGMVAGDGDADGSVFMRDRTVWRINLGAINSYQSSDYDMDGNTFMSDRTLWRGNLEVSNPFNQPQTILLYKSQVPDK